MFQCGKADRNAAHLVGPHCMKDTLASLAVVRRLLGESFWPLLDQRNRETAVPPETYLHDLAGAIQMSTHRERAQAFFGEAMHEVTGYADTHPALADRLAALTRLPARDAPDSTSSAIPQLLGTEQDHAARYFLGKTCAALCEQLNREWAEQTKDAWKQKYDENQTVQARMAKLRARWPPAR